MNIILVPAGHDYSMISSERLRIDFADEHHDPIEMVKAFHSFFGRVDGREQVPTMRLDTEQVKASFWDRDDFMDTLRELCVNDVYLQATDWYSMTMGFLSIEDHDAVKRRMEMRRQGFTRTFPKELSPEIERWLKSHVGLTHYQWDSYPVDDGQAWTVREEVVAGLMDIKFCATRQGDHSKAAPPLPERYAA